MKKLICIIVLILSQYVIAQPPSITDPTPLSVCDTNNDGFESFDLTSKNAEILGSLNPLQFSVTYHGSLVGSFQNNNLITSPFINTLANNQLVYVRVQSISNPSSFSTTTLELIINAVSINDNISAYAIYENPFDGFATFNLTTRNELITTDADHQIKYFTSQNDALNLTNEILNPNAFVGSNLQIIWFRVTDTTTTCFTLGSYLLKVFDSSLVVNIPDPKFKARLLLASPTEQIAMSTPNNWIKLDANNDGEIQVSEALEVTYFRLSGFIINESDKFSSIEGINAFTNLVNLDCGYNLLQTINVDSLVNLKILAITSNNFTSFNLQNFANLEELYCGANPLTSLNLVSLPNLKVLYCGNSLLTSLNVSQFSNLTEFDCRNAQITSLNVTGLSNLVTINCSFNQLTTVNLQGLNALALLNGSNNQMTTINLQQTPIIGDVTLNNNLLTTIDVNGLNNLIFLRCNNNLFTTINIENLPAIEEFRCRENSLLETLFVKNGLAEFIWAANCPNLEYVCADESQIQSIQTGFGGVPNDCVVNSYCTFLPGGNYNSIVGNIIMDANSNGCDGSDLPQPNIRIDINDGTNQGATFSNNSGGYGFYTQDGDFTITPSIENPSWFTISPYNATISFDESDNQVVTQNFCIAPNGLHPDIEIVISPIFPSIPGQDAVYQIVYKNKGNQTLSQTNGISLDYNQNAMEFISTSFTPSVTNLGNLKWSYANLIPFESRSFEVKFNINSATDANPVVINDVLQFTVSILPTTNDETVADNTFIYNETVVDSFITNSITCVEGTSLPPSSIGDYLHYIINFENTGTATADNIVLQMDIDEEQFEINTLQVLNTSHSCYTRVSGNIIEFVLQNIALETGGHGNVLLKIRTKSDLATGAIVSRDANIFFDYNAPIDTGIANTTFQALSTCEFVTDNSINIYPNPAVNFVTINSDSTINSIQLYDVQGRLLQTKIENQTEVTFDISNQSNGIYFFKIQSDNGVKVIKLIKE